MYFPYFRGKQYDLITIRECAQLMAEAKFVPIIEPVKETLNGLIKSVEAVSNAGGEMVLIVNPPIGDHSGNPEALNNLVQVELKEHDNISPGYILTKETTLEDVNDVCKLYSNRIITLIHSGFSNAKALSEQLEKCAVKIRHVFIEDQCALVYRRHFKNTTRILIRDGFKRARTNRDYPEIEPFSDLHATYTELGMNGFGDYLIVGDEYIDSGGLPSAIVIHLTCIDDESDDMMFTHHFKSIRHEERKDLAGKFGEALKKLVTEVDRDGTKILRTQAVDEFYALHLSGHFPGLGYVKKLSMSHHIETLAAYFRRA